MQDRIKLTIDQGVARVSLNRPHKHNALDVAMFEALDRCIKKLKSERTLRAVVLSGEGESFCSGLDVKSVMANKKAAFKLLWKWLPGSANLVQRVVVGWRQIPVPVIAAIHGKCWGGGMQLALGADFRIAHPESSLAIMEARWGLIPDMGGTLALRESVAADHAMQLAMTAEPISAARAKAIGLITDVTDDARDAAWKLAMQLVNRSPDSNRAIKRFYHATWCAKQRRILARETLNQWRMLLGKNQRIAVARELGKSDQRFHL